MIKVKVKSYFYMREAIGKPELELEMEKNTVRDLLLKLTERYGELKKVIIEQQTMEIQPYILVLLNGRRVNLSGGLDTQLNNGDVVAIFPPVMGG